MIKAERAQTKSRNGAIGYRRKLPSVEITLPRDMCVVLVYFLTLRMSILNKIMLDDKLVTL